MNKEYQQLTKEIISVKDSNGEILERELKVENPTKVLELENKIETLSQMICDINKKLSVRKEFLKFAPIWIIIHLLVPLLVLALVITSCLVPKLFWLLPYVVEFCPYALACIIGSILVLITKYITKKDINGLISKLEVLNEMKDERERDLTKELSKELELTNSEDLELNKSIQLKESLTRAEEKVLSTAYSNGFNQRIKKLVRKQL